MQTPNLTFTSLQNAHGPMPYSMTNDYMFRAVLQSNNFVLRGLIGSLLHLSEEEMVSVEITNPIVLGEAIEDKEFRLDINLILNDNTLINLEMQIANQLNWTNRSLSYICRSFDQLNHGQKYNSIKPVIHIAFLDYTLFTDSPKFYATYKLMNTRNHHIYSDNFILSVIDLNQINLATEDDKLYQIDYWASLFKATTWEELKMISSKNEYLNQASNTIFKLSADDLIRKRCLDREDYYSDIESYKDEVARLQENLLKEQNKNAKILEENAKLLEWAKTHGYTEE